MRYLKILLMVFTFSLELPALAAGIPVKLFKNPNCTCCDAWARHLEANGFKVQIVNATDLTSISQKYGVPENLEGCHTAIVDGYVVEGLVPVRYIKRLIKEHPQVKGIALPGMPLGVPGMPGAKSGPLSIYYIDASAPPRVFASF